MEEKIKSIREFLKIELSELEKAGRGYDILLNIVAKAENITEEEYLYMVSQIPMTDRAIFKRYGLKI